MACIRDAEQQHQEEEPCLEPCVFLTVQKQHCDGHGAHARHADDGIAGKTRSHKGSGQFLIKPGAVQYGYVIFRFHPSCPQHLHHHRQEDHRADGEPQEAVQAELPQEAADHFPFPSLIDHKIPEYGISHREEAHHVEEIKVHHPGYPQGKDIHKGLLSRQDLIHA